MGRKIEEAKCGGKKRAKTKVWNTSVLGHGDKEESAKEIRRAANEGTTRRMWCQKPRYLRKRLKTSHEYLATEINS